MRRTKQYTARFSETARADIETAAEKAMPHETGGILLGWERDRHLHVEAAMEVPDSTSSRTGYVRRAQDAQALLDAALSAEPPGSPLGYVGEWHSHPAPIGPSRQDFQTIRQFNKDLDRALLLVVVSWQADTWAPNVAVSVKRRIQRCELLN